MLLGAMSPASKPTPRGLDMAARKRTKNALFDPESSLRPETEYTDVASGWRSRDLSELEGWTPAERSSLRKAKGSGELSKADKQNLKKMWGRR